MTNIATHFSTNLPPSLAASLEGSKCEYRRLGSSGLKVSVPILGAMSFGRKDWMDWVLEEDEVGLPQLLLVSILSFSSFRGYIVVV